MVLEGGKSFYTEWSFSEMEEAYDDLGPFDFSVEVVDFSQWPGLDWEIVNPYKNSLFEFDGKYITSEIDYAFEIRFLCKTIGEQKFGSANTIMLEDLYKGGSGVELYYRDGVAPLNPNLPYPDLPQLKDGSGRETFSDGRYSNRTNSLYTATIEPNSRVSLESIACTGERFSGDYQLVEWAIQP